MANCKELVVVVFILGIALALGTGATKYGSPQWQKITCSNNLKELYKLHISYQNDNNSIIAPRIDRTNRNRWKYWPQFINKYGKDPMLFYCPANHKSKKMFDSDPLQPKVFSLKSASYGMNYTLGGYKKYGNKWDSKMTKISQASNPSYMVFLGDSKTMQLRPTVWCWNTDYAPVHSDASNFTMIDGSVKTLNKSNLGLASLGGKKTWKNWKVDRKRWKNIK